MDWQQTRRYEQIRTDSWHDWKQTVLEDDGKDLPTKKWKWSLKVRKVRICSLPCLFKMLSLWKNAFIASNVSHDDEGYYKKSENARHLSRTALLWLDQWRRLAGSPIHTETADEFRVAIAFGRTWKIMDQSARRIYGFCVTVYVRTPWPKPPKQIRLLVRLYLLLRLHRPLYRDTCTDIWWCIACGIAIRIAILGLRYDTRIAGPSIAIHRCIVVLVRS